jgi:SAM-dependent methyltransferase
MDRSVLDFVGRHLDEEEVRGMSVIEAGSRSVAGAGQSVRPMIEKYRPASYVGTDIEPGLYVDEVCDAGELQMRFGDNRFDIVVTTEMLEHTLDWRRVVSNLKRVAKPGGALIVTTRSYGFPYHGWPQDYWRYELDDLRTIFSDFEIEAIEPDPEAPGVFMKARKPASFREADLSRHKLFSMVKQRRTASASDWDERLFMAAYTPVRLVRAWAPVRVKRAVKRTRLSREHRVLARARRGRDREYGHLDR